MATQLCNKILAIVFFCLVATIHSDKASFKVMSELFFSKYFELMIRIQPPKDLVLGLLPMLVGKAILLIIDQKIAEKLRTLIDDGYHEIRN